MRAYTYAYELRVKHVLPSLIHMLIDACSPDLRKSNVTNLEANVRFALPLALRSVVRWSSDACSLPD